MFRFSNHVRNTINLSVLPNVSASKTKTLMFRRVPMANQCSNFPFQRINEYSLQNSEFFCKILRTSRLGIEAKTLRRGVRRYPRYVFIQRGTGGLFLGERGKKLVGRRNANCIVVSCLPEIKFRLNSLLRPGKRNVNLQKVGGSPSSRNTHTKLTRPTQLSTKGQDKIRAYLVIHFEVRNVHYLKAFRAIVSALTKEFSR